MDSSFFIKPLPTRQAAPRRPMDSIFPETEFGWSVVANFHYPSSGSNRSTDGKQITVI